MSTGSSPRWARWGRASTLSSSPLHHGAGVVVGSSAVRNRLATPARVASGMACASRSPRRSGQVADGGVGIAADLPLRRGAGRRWRGSPRPPSPGRRAARRGRSATSAGDVCRASRKTTGATASDRSGSTRRTASGSSPSAARRWATRTARERSADAAAWSPSSRRGRRRRAAPVRRPRRPPPGVTSAAQGAQASSTAIAAIVERRSSACSARHAEHPGAFGVDQQEVALGGAAEADDRRVRAGVVGGRRRRRSRATVQRSRRAVEAGRRRRRWPWPTRDAITASPTVIASEFGQGTRPRSWQCRPTARRAASRAASRSGRCRAPSTFAAGRRRLLRSGTSRRPTGRSRRRRNRRVSKLR